MRSGCSSVWSLIAACWLLQGSALYAQTTAARLTGNITDPSGAGIPGAEVTAINEQTGAKRQATSNELGYYVVPMLPPGSYRITVHRGGFQDVNRPGVILEVDQVARVDFALPVGKVTESVEVTAQAPLLQTATSSVGQVVESQQISDLPLNTRTALGLLGLSAGVAVGRGFDPNTFNEANNFSASGSRPGQNEFLLDGVPNTLPGVWPGRGILGVTVPVDSVQEFKVQVNNFAAEYGRTGGGLINTVTRSGTNAFHGSLYHYLRNSAMDANDFFSNRSGIELGSFKRNQFGGTFGGPILRNRTFFFVNYQGTRARVADSATFTVPTQVMKGGDFSSLVTPDGKPVIIYDPLTTQTVGKDPIRQPFPGNRIPADRINPVSTKVVSYYPQPNQPGYVNNLVLSDSDRQTNDIWGIRLDHLIGTHHQLSGRFYYTRDDTLNPNWYGNLATSGQEGRQQDVYSVAADYV